MHSWRVLLLSQFDPALFKQYDFSEPWDGPNNRLLLNRRPRTYALHDRNDEPGSITNYLVVVGPDTMWPGSEPTDKPFGGKQVLIVENVGADVQWTEPRDLNLATMNLDLAASAADGISSSYLPAAIALSNGTIRKLPSEKISAQELRGLLTGAIDLETALNSSDFQLEDGRDRPKRDGQSSR
jgi:hypothetical protein